MAEGWIKIHRSVLDHWLYKTKKPKTRREAWEDMLMLVNYEKSQSMIRGQLYDCDRGQSLYSLDTWAEKFNWSKQMVRTFFDLLQREEMIKLEGLQYTTRLTICNYDKYQSTATHQKHTDNTPITHEQHAANTPLTPIKEVKEDKKEKNIRNVIPPSLEMVIEYCKERGNKIEPQAFIDWNEARGWMLNGRKMKDWQAAIRTWEQRDKQRNNENSSGTNKRNIKRVNNLWN